MSILSFECGVSEKSDGNMSVFRAATGDEYVLENRRKFLSGADEDLENVVSCLVGGYEVVHVRDSSERYVSADALVTTSPDIILTVTAADCYPVFLWDEQVGVVGMVHVSWRSAASRIITRTIDRMQELGASDIIAAVGPGLSPSNFEVYTKPFKEEFTSLRNIDCDSDVDYVGEFMLTDSLVGKSLFDLSGLIIHELRRRGVTIDERDGRCTYDTEELYSYRADGFDQCGKIESQLAYIKLSATK